MALSSHLCSFLANCFPIFASFPPLFSSFLCANGTNILLLFICVRFFRLFVLTSFSLSLWKCIKAHKACFSALKCKGTFYVYLLIVTQFFAGACFVGASFSPKETQTLTSSLSCFTSFPSVLSVSPFEMKGFSNRIWPQIGAAITVKK